MTTEIFRGMLYAEADEHDDPLADVEAVVLDESSLHERLPARHGPEVVEASERPPRCGWWPCTATRLITGSSPTGSKRSMVRPLWCSTLQTRSAAVQLLHMARACIPASRRAGTGSSPARSGARRSSGHKRKGRSAKRVFAARATADQLRGGADGGTGQMLPRSISFSAAAVAIRPCVIWAFSAWSTRRNRPGSGHD